MIINGDLVYVSNPDPEYGKSVLRDHMSLFGKVLQVKSDKHALVEFLQNSSTGETVQYLYKFDELSPAEEFYSLPFEGSTDKIARICAEFEYNLRRNLPC